MYVLLLALKKLIYSLVKPTLSLQYYDTRTFLLCRWWTFRLFPISCLTKNAAMNISWCLLMLKCKNSSSMVFPRIPSPIQGHTVKYKIVLMSQISQQEYFKYKCLYFFDIAVPYPPIAWIRCSNASLEKFTFGIGSSMGYYTRGRCLIS